MKITFKGGEVSHILKRLTSLFVFVLAYVLCSRLSFCLFASMLAKNKMGKIQHCHIIKSFV